MSLMLFVSILVLSGMWWYAGMKCGRAAIENQWIEFIQSANDKLVGEFRQHNGIWQVQIPHIHVNPYTGKFHCTPGEWMDLRSVEESHE